MKHNWVLIAAELLDAAAGEFANHDCNDWEWPLGWTGQQRRELVTAMWCANLRKTLEQLTDDDRKEIEANVAGEYGPPDWWLMRFLSSKLREVE